MGFTRLVEHLHALPGCELPRDLLDHARIALLDNLGCGLFGARQEWGRIVTELVRDERSQGAASVYGSSSSCAPARAALAHGTCTHGFELDDIILGALSHPGAVVVPAALAAAESSGTSGLELLRGIVAGYEVMARVGAALGPSGRPGPGAARGPASRRSPAVKARATGMSACQALSWPVVPSLNAARAWRRRNR